MPNIIVITRKTTVWLLKSVLLLLGSRSACVTAILSLTQDTDNFVGRKEEERMKHSSNGINMTKKKEFLNCLEQRLLKAKDSNRVNFYTRNTTRDIVN